MPAYNEAIKRDPTNFQACVDCGDTYRALEQYEEAIKSYIQAMNMDPENISLYHKLGATFEKSGQTEEAINNYTQAIKIKPHDEDFYYKRAHLYFDLHQYEDAIDDYTKAIEYSTRGIVIAITDEETGKLINTPRLSKAYYYRGLAYEKLGELKKAKEDFRILTLIYTENQEYKKKLEEIKNKIKDK